MKVKNVSEACKPAQEVVTQLVDPIYAAQMLKVAVPTLSDWRVKGVGPRYRKCGSRVRYAIEDLEAYLRENTFNSTSEYGMYARTDIPTPESK